MDEVAIVAVVEAQGTVAVAAQAAIVVDIVGIIHGEAGLQGRMPMDPIRLLHPPIPRIRLHELQGGGCVYFFPLEAVGTGFHACKKNSCVLVSYLFYYFCLLWAFKMEVEGFY